MFSLFKTHGPLMRLGRQGSHFPGGPSGGPVVLIKSLLAALLEPLA